jgi:hypothetical protein
MRYLLLIGLLLCSAANAAITNIASVTARNGSSLGLTLDSTGANLLTIRTSCQHGAPDAPSTWVDNKGNTWSSVVSAGFRAGGIYTVTAAASVGTSHTVTVTAVNNSCYVIFDAWAGAVSTSAVDQLNSDGAGGATMTAGVTPTVNGELVIGVACGVGQTIVSQTGFSVTDASFNTDGTTETTTAGHTIQTTATAITYTVVVSSGDNGGLVIASFKPAGSSSAAVRHKVIGSY